MTAYRAVTVGEQRSRGVSRRAGARLRSVTIGLRSTSVPGVIQVTPAMMF